MMGRTALGFCCARRMGVLLVSILGLCICSIVLSVFYVHSAQLSPSVDILEASGGERKQHRRQHTRVMVVDDSNRLVPQHHAATLGGHKERKPEDGAHDIKSLNNMDIAFHIEEKKEREHHNEIQLNSNSNKSKGVTEERAILDQLKNNPDTSIRVTKEDKWPTHNKDQKIKYKGYQSSNPLYEKKIRTRENWNGEKFIVYLCYSNISCAGWGDRQHGIFSTYLISLVTNRTFKVDFGSPCPLTKLYHPRIANWKVEPSELDGLSSTHLYVVNDRYFREDMKKIDFNIRYPHDVVYLTTNYDYYYSLKANPIYRDIFHKKVRNRPRPIIFADLWQLIFKMNKRIIRRFTPVLDRAHASSSHKLVCAHIRFGRNPSIPNDGDIRNTLTSIKPFWEFVKKHSDPNKYRLFVASDWEGFRSKVNNLYRDIAISMDGQVMHIDKYVEGKACNQTSCVDSEALCNGLEMVIADQHVLSKCDILLLTYSVFGKSAAYLRRSNKDLYLMDQGQINSLVLFNERFNKH